tara:strand:- start:166 stop:552 length:387 start_codon:yes stop_codon:yes gene_type:complete
MLDQSITKGNNMTFTLNKNQKILAQHLIDHTEAEQCIVYHDFFPEAILKKLNMNFQQVKGLFGSLVKADLLSFDQNVNGQYDTYTWCTFVMGDDFGRTISTVDELIAHINKVGSVKASWENKHKVEYN